GPAPGSRGGGGALRSSWPAPVHAVARHVEVEVISVQRVPVGAQRDADQIAVEGLLTELTEEARAAGGGRLVQPAEMTEHPHAAAVAQRERAQIDGVAVAVLAHPVEAYHLATAVRANVVDAAHLAAQVLVRELLQQLLQIDEGERHAAAHDGG